MGIQVTKEMVIAFCNALGDGSITEQEFKEVEIGLKAAMCNISEPCKNPSMGVPDNWNAQCVCGHHWHATMPSENCPSCNPSLIQNTERCISMKDAFNVISSFYWFTELFKNKYGKNPSVIDWYEAEGRQLLKSLSDYRFHIYENDQP